MRDNGDLERSLRVRPGAQNLVGNDQIKDSFYTTGKLKEIFTNQRPGSTNEVVYQRSLEIAPDVFRNLIVESDKEMTKLILKIQPLAEEL